MSSLLLRNIKTLVQTDETGTGPRKGDEMKKLPVIDDAFLYIQKGIIAGFGPMSDISGLLTNRDTRILDLDGRYVMPAFCDSHTHLVYAGSREKEYIDRVRGLSYEEIARKGGGILNSAALLNRTSEEELFEQSLPRVWEIIRKGTGAVEIKSGYGLNPEAELKMLRVIRRISRELPITVKATFLGAHAIPPEYKGKKQDYVDLVINEMIPQVAAEDLADYIDVFCDKGFFSAEDTDRILMAGLKYGLRAKIHANELDFSGGIQTGVKYNAVSVDHLEFTGKDEIESLLNSETIPTVLPGASFFLEMPYAPARLMIDSGLPLALASDFNPGSSPSGDMKFIMSLALIKLHMFPEEIINAVTINPAFAMGVQDELGSIRTGKTANLIITKKIPSLDFIPYSYGSDFIDRVILNGEEY